MVLEHDEKPELCCEDIIGTFISHYCIDKVTNKNGDDDYFIHPAKHGAKRGSGMDTPPTPLLSEVARWSSG